MESVAVRKVRRDVRDEYEFITNWKLVQATFAELRVEKVAGFLIQEVPVNRLSKSKFQDNLEFLQWFRKFIDVNLSPENAGMNQSTTPQRSSPAKLGKSMSFHQPAHFQNPDPVFLGFIDYDSGAEFGNRL